MPQITDVYLDKEEDMLAAIKKFDDTEYESVTIKCEQAPEKPKEEAPVVTEETAVAATDAPGDEEKKDEKDA